MRISEFALDGNGAWPDLRARALDDGLTVFFGPAGTGKTTAASFIGHVLYGRQPSAAWKHVTGPRYQPEGELQVRDANGTFRLRRYSDVAPPGRLTVSSLEGRAVDQHTVERLLAGGPAAVVSQLYFADFASPTGIERLLSHDFARGFRTLIGSDAGHPRPAQSRTDIRELLTRRDELARELEGRLAHGRQQSRELEDRLTELVSLRRQRELDVANLRQRLQSVDAELTDIEAKLRYGRLEAQIDDQQAASMPIDLDSRLEDVDEQIDRWRETLAELERREASVQARLAQLHPDDANNELPLADQRAFLGVVRRLVSDLEGEVARLAHLDGSQPCVCREAHQRLRPIAEMLGKQTALLDWSLAEQSQVAEYLDLEGESEHLVRSKHELQQQLSHLLNRRQTLLRSARPTRKRVARDSAQLDMGGPHDLQPEQYEQLATRQAQLQRDQADLRQHLAEALRSLEGLVGQYEGLARSRAGVLSAVPIDQIRSELSALESRLQAHYPVDAVRAHEVVSDGTMRASDYLAQLTSGELLQLRQGARHPATVVRRDGRQSTIDALPAAERDLAFLALTLALVAAHARRGATLPLILDEPFEQLTPQQIVTAAAVLDEFGRAGHQVITFTRCAAAIERFQTLGSEVRGMHEIRRASDADVELRTTSDTPVERRHVALLNVARIVGSQNGHHDASPLVDTAPAAADIPFQLRVGDSIARFPALGGETESAFAEVGIHTVGDLINAKPAEVATQLGRAGITEDIVRLWQTHQVLMCFVPGISLEDAQVLTGAGVFGVDDLLEAEEQELADRLQNYLQSPRGQRFRQRGYRFDNRLLVAWLRGARQFRDRWLSSTHAASWRRRNRRFGAGQPSSQQESSRQKSAESRPTRKPAAVELPSAPLLRSSPVVDAPSIGPKTAKRLKAIGIHTIDDLLFADAAQLAEQLGVRHITVVKIEAWQQQAHLACELPQLRSHDAQILVACGLTNVEDLARMKPEELLAHVLPFCESSDGERILRGSNKPDEDECADWIAWARKRHSLEAA
jgi:predicted flap endonuclease-1-like 5' DNA nuclease